MQDTQRCIFFENNIWFNTLRTLAINIAVFAFNRIVPKLLGIIVIVFIFASVFYHGVYYPTFESAYKGEPSSYFGSLYNIYFRPLVTTIQEVHGKVNYLLLFKDTFLGTVCLLAFAFILLTYPIKEVG